MRIWDINPGYLNRQSLLGEHRELHGIVAILEKGKRGYANHPETRRWVGFGWALQQRHSLIGAEMTLRGYNDRTPVSMSSGRNRWPDIYIDPPQQQLQILHEKYLDKESGRIPLPRDAQQFWSHHKYSVMARDPELYRRLGKEVAGKTPEGDLEKLSLIVTETLREPPSAGGLHNALQHMWGHVSAHATLRSEVENWSTDVLLQNVQKLALAHQEPYLMSSTALSELVAWL